MEHPFFTATTTRAEALRWLSISEKLLSARDLMGSKSFAMRARDSDPTLTPADEILAVVDTLLAGDRRIGNNNHLQDWYAILRLTPQQGRDTELVANQYRTLVIQLNPQKNKFPFAEPAFRLVVDAWSVLSNPSSKSTYDKELAFYLQHQQQQQQQPDPFNDPNSAMQQNFMFFGGGAAASQPQVHYPQVQQVHAQPLVEPVVSGSTRVPQNFMNFSSASNILFGSPSGSGSKSSHEPVHNQTQENYSNFGGSNVGSGSAYGVAHEQLNNNNVNKQKEPQQNYFDASDRSTGNVNVSENVENVERVDEPANDGGSKTIWTACPYCYYMYEYPSEYADCTLRCQNCKKAFQAVVVNAPPPSANEKDGYFCCWGFLPLGFSMEDWEKNRVSATKWTPFSPMFNLPQLGGNNSVNKKARKRKSSGPRVYVDDDEVFVELSGSSESDEDWNTKKKQSKTKNVKGKGLTGTTKKTQVVSPTHVVEIPKKTTNVEPSVKIGAAANGRKPPGRGAKSFGKLDLNVELSNEAEEPAIPRVAQGNGPSGRGEDENIEGIGFFEGLDEFLSSLPILNVVGDDKVVKAA